MLTLKWEIFEITVIATKTTMKIEYSTDVWRYSHAYKTWKISAKIVHWTRITMMKTKKQKKTHTPKIISLPTCFDCTIPTISTLKHVRAMCLRFFFPSLQPFLPVFPASVYVCGCLLKFHISCMRYVYRKHTIEAKSVVIALLSNQSAVNREKKFRENEKRTRHQHK